MSAGEDDDKVVDFGRAKSPHEFARKEQRMEDLRSRFNAVLKEARPEAAKGKRGGKKKKRQKKQASGSARQHEARRRAAIEATRDEANRRGDAQ